MSAPKLFTHRLAILSFALVVVIIANWVLYNNKDYGFTRRYASYLTLYYPRETPIIRNLKVLKRGCLQITFSEPPSDRWEIRGPDGSIARYNGLAPEIALAPETNDYFLVPLQSGQHLDAFRLRIDYTPAEVYREAGNSGNDNYFLVRSDAPVGDFRRFPLKTFVWSGKFYAPEEWDAVKRLLQEKPIFAPNAPTEEKLVKLAIFLLDALRDRGGIPSDTFNRESPLSQFIDAAAGRGSVWCGNYADIYVFFANAAGLPTRKVSISGRLGDAVLSGHTFAETYIREKGQWAQVDLASRRCFVKSADGDFLNAAELFAINTIGADDGMISTVYEKNAIARVPYVKTAKPERRYYNKDAELIYHLPRQRREGFFAELSGYLFPDLYFSLRGDNGRDPIKKAFLWTLAATVVLWGAAMARFLWKRAENRAREPLFQREKKRCQEIYPDEILSAPGEPRSDCQ